MVDLQSRDIAHTGYVKLCTYCCGDNRAIGQSKVFKKLILIDSLPSKFNHLNDSILIAKTDVILHCEKTYNGVLFVRVKIITINYIILGEI